MTGALSVEVMESGPFTTLEQVMPAGTGRPRREVVRGFGRYTAVAAVAGTAGALPGALPPDPRLLGGVLTVVGAAGMVPALRLPAGVEAPAMSLGVLRTMVFTHIPANLLPAAVPFASGLGGAIALLTARARPAGAAPAGFLLTFGLALPFVIAGAAKAAYDLTLWRIFRSVRLPAEGPS
ncbi:hypothetical protein HII36_39485 [Nonomuraea sp. NN258]|uniref:hypothetical protein n=1 Tax=Nonomuraea antri TaxID=2730852 RepID=UPI001569D590|nr:hypothetical protein [Nonomuraea antri]NRQ37871.1 hypothetical protein [Nonomuraea antri]